MSAIVGVPRIMGANSPPARPSRVVGWHFDYQVRFGSVVAGAKSALIELPIQLGAPFCLRGIGGYNIADGGVAAALNDVLVTFSDSNDNFLQNQAIGVTNTGSGDWLEGGLNALYEPVHNQVVYAPNSVLQVQVTNNGADTLADPRIVFRGTKLYYDELIYCPSYPPRFSSQPFQYSVQFPIDPLGTGTITIGASTTLRSVPVQAFGTDFVLRGGVFTPVSGSTADIEILLRDQYERPYANDFIHWNWLFSSAFAQRPGVWYPEIYIPKDRMILMDIQQNVASQGVFALTFEGSRVFPK